MVERVERRFRGWTAYRCRAIIQTCRVNRIGQTTIVILSLLWMTVGVYDQVEAV